METVQENHLLKRPPGTIENIRKIYNLDKPERLEAAVNILQEWIQKQDHIIKKDFSKLYLEKTLLSCKGSVEKAKMQIDRLCTMRTMVPRFFSTTNVKVELQSILDLGLVVPLPKLTKDYYRVIIIRLNNKSFTSENFMQYFQYNMVLSEYVKANDYVNGFIVVEDYSQLNLVELMAKMNTIDFQQYVTILTEGYGARMKSFNILTASKTIEILIKTIKPLLSEKIGKRLHVRRNLDELRAVIPKEILPVEYGGSEKSIEALHVEWVNELSSEKHVEYMKMINKACTDETKRCSVKFNVEHLGMPGSFRNLSVD